MATPRTGLTTNAQVVAPGILHIDLDPIVPELAEDVPPPIATLERGLKSREDKGKGIKLGEKRNASKAGLTEEGPPKKTFRWTKDDPDRSDRFFFKYVGDKYLMQDSEAASHLWCNMNLPGAQGIPNPDEILFSEEYKKFARSSFEV